MKNKFFPLQLNIFPSGHRNRVAVYISGYTLGKYFEIISSAKLVVSSSTHMEINLRGLLNLEIPSKSEQLFVLSVHRCPSLKNKNAIESFYNIDAFTPVFEVKAGLH